MAGVDTVRMPSESLPPLGRSMDGDAQLFPRQGNDARASIERHNSEPRPANRGDSASRYRSFSSAAQGRGGGPLDPARSEAAETWTFKNVRSELPREYATRSDPFPAPQSPRRSQPYYTRTPSAIRAQAEAQLSGRPAQEGPPATPPGIEPLVAGSERAGPEPEGESEDPHRKAEAKARSSRRSKESGRKSKDKGRKGEDAAPGGGPPEEAGQRSQRPTDEAAPDALRSRRSRYSPSEGPAAGDAAAGAPPPALSPQAPKLSRPQKVGPSRLRTTSGSIGNSMEGGADAVVVDGAVDLSPGGTQVSISRFASSYSMAGKARHTPGFTKNPLMDDRIEEQLQAASWHQYKDKITVADGGILFGEASPIMKLSRSMTDAKSKLERILPTKDRAIKDRKQWLEEHKTVGEAVGEKDARDSPSPQARAARPPDPALPGPSRPNLDDILSTAQQRQSETMSAYEQELDAGPRNLSASFLPAPLSPSSPHALGMNPQGLGMNPQNDAPPAPVAASGGRSGVPKQELRPLPAQAYQTMMAQDAENHNGPEGGILFNDKSPLTRMYRGLAKMGQSAKGKLEKTGMLPQNVDHAVKNRQQWLHEERLLQQQLAGQAQEGSPLGPPAVGGEAPRAVPPAGGAPSRPSGFRRSLPKDSAAADRRKLLQEETAAAERLAAEDQAEAEELALAGRMPPELAKKPSGGMTGMFSRGMSQLRGLAVRPAF